MQNTEQKSESNEKSTPEKSMHTNGKDTKETSVQRQGNRTLGAYVAYPIVVSEKQYSTVSEEHSRSMDLLNSSASALLGAMQSCVPPENSGRSIGEYTGQNMRQLAKSICDIINTKTTVVRSMYQIARDEV